VPALPNFCSGTYESASPNVDVEACFNLFPERSESAGAKSQIALMLRPGTNLFAQLPEAGVTSLFPINGRGFAAGAHLWEVNGSGVVTDRGSLGGTQPVLPCQMAANETQLLAMNNGNLYILTLATNVLVPVNMAQFPGGAGSISQIGFADGYFFATIRNSHTFCMSALEDGTVWSGLDQTTVSLFPDNFNSFICDHREAWFFSGKKGAGYYNAGAGNPPYIPIQGAFTEFGAGPTFATVQLDNSIFWIDLNERGQGVARKLAGYTDQRVSNHAVEFAWEQYATISDARAWTCQIQGHNFWVIYFPTANATWVYDVSTGFWTQWAFYNQINGTFEAFHGQAHMECFGKHLIGDWASGNIYELSAAFLTDAGNPLRWLRRTPILSNDNKWIAYSEIELDADVGLATGSETPDTVLGWGKRWGSFWGGHTVPGLVDGNGDPRPAQVMLRWSNDGAKTWGATYLLNAGFPGEYNTLIRKAMLGQARKRVFEFSGTDPVAWRIANAYGKWEPSLELT
jgi:hypothetical protein